MSYRLDDVVHEGPHGWVYRKGPNSYEVYHKGTTHSTRKGIYSGLADSLERAKAHADSLDMWGKRA